MRSSRIEKPPHSTVSYWERERRLAPSPSSRRERGKEGMHHDQGKLCLAQRYCQSPGRQTQFCPCGTHCPGTQVVIRCGGSSQCPAVHCQPLFQVQYPGTQTYADEGGMVIASWRRGGGGCCAISSRVSCVTPRAISAGVVRSRTTSVVTASLLPTCPRPACGAGGGAGTTTVLSR